MINKDDLIKRLEEEYSYRHPSSFEKQADVLLENLLPELEINIIEWIKHEKLSNVYIRDVTLQNILDLWMGRRSIEEAVRALRVYKDDEDLGWGMLYDWLITYD